MPAAPMKINLDFSFLSNKSDMENFDTIYQFEE